MTEWFQEIFQQIIDLAGAHPSWVGILIFIFSISEGLAVIGATLPGETVLLGIIAIAAAGGGDVWMMFLWASLGATAGDGISFWMGRRYGQTILDWPGLRSNPGLLEKGRAFLGSHGAKSIAIARFIPVLRSIVPLAAGILGMPALRFYVANILSAIVWAALHVFPAAALGLAYRTLGEVSGRLAVVLLGLLVLTAAALWLVRLFILRAMPRVGRAWRAFVDWLERRGGREAQYMARLLHPDRPEFAGLIIWGLILTLAAAGLISILDSLTGVGALTRADAAINHLLQNLRSDPVDAFMVMVTAFGDPLPATGMALVLVLTLLAWRAWRLALACAAFIAAAALAVPLIQVILHLSPPMAATAHDGPARFMDSHVAMMVTICGILAILVSRGLSAGGKIAVFSLAVLWSGLMATSRVWLSAQWPSVVLGGLLSGIMLTALFGLFFSQLKTRAYSRAMLAALVLATCAGLGGMHARTTFSAALAHYAPREKMRVFPLPVWTAESWRALPMRRIDLGGERKEPLLLQWAGSRAAITAALRARGWRKARPFTWLDGLNLFSPNASLAAIPPLPVLHDGRLPVLTFVHARKSPGQRLVLRFWRSSLAVQTQTAQVPVLLAAATLESMEWPLSWLALMRELPPPRKLPRDLAAGLRQDPALATLRPQPDASLLVWPRPAGKGR